MIRTLPLAVLVSVSLSAQDSWQPLRFLLGTWEARTTQTGSAGASVQGRYTFRLELNEKVLARHILSAACKGPESFDCEHSDLLYFYHDSPSQPVRAIYFDNEGHTIHYRVADSAPNRIVLESEAPPAGGPVFRLIYERDANVMRGRFQMRPPGQADFRCYLEWTGNRR